METDGVLIERSARGRPDAFVEVVRRHEVAVHAYLARRAGRQAADDLLGEVWVRAFGGRAGFDPAHGGHQPCVSGPGCHMPRYRRGKVGHIGQHHALAARTPALIASSRPSSGSLPSIRTPLT